MIIINLMPYPELGPIPLDLVNGSADTGDLTGWEVVRGSPTVSTGPSGAGTLPYEGSHYFYPGAVNHSTMAQTVAVPSSLIAAVDADLVTINVRWFHSGQANAPDRGSISIAALDANGVAISCHVEDYYNPSIETVWNQVDYDFKLPVGTRSVRLYVDARIGGFSSNDYYTDAITGHFVRAVPETVELPIINCDGMNGATGWTVTNGQLVIPGDIRKPRIGNNHFYAGNNLFSAAYQNVIVPSTAHAAIDAGSAILNWEIWQYCIGADTSRMRVIFYEADGITQTGSSTPGYTNFTDPDWTRVARSASIPANTRIIRFVQEYDRNAGTSSDGYLDAFSAEIVL